MLLIKGPWVVAKVVIIGLGAAGKFVNLRKGDLDTFYSTVRHTALLRAFLLVILTPLLSYTSFPPLHWPPPTFLLVSPYLYPSYSLFLHLGSLPGIMHFTLTTDVAMYSETSVPYHITIRCHHLETATWTKQSGFDKFTWNSLFDWCWYFIIVRTQRLIAVSTKCRHWTPSEPVHLQNVSLIWSSPFPYNLS
jgi:hypothetical protein